MMYSARFVIVIVQLDNTYMVFHCLPQVPGLGSINLGHPLWLWLCFLHMGVMYFRYSSKTLIWSKVSHESWSHRPLPSFWLVLPWSYQTTYFNCSWLVLFKTYNLSMHLEPSFIIRRSLCHFIRFCSSLPKVCQVQCTRANVIDKKTHLFSI